jgi:hypothetical protein
VVGGDVRALAVAVLGDDAGLEGVDDGDAAELGVAGEVDQGAGGLGAVDRELHGGPARQGVGERGGREREVDARGAEDRDGVRRAVADPGALPGPGVLVVLDRRAVAASAHGEIDGGDGDEGNRGGGEPRGAPRPGGDRAPRHVVPGGVRTGGVRTGSR